MNHNDNRIFLNDLVSMSYFWKFCEDLQDTDNQLWDVIVNDNPHEIILEFVDGTLYHFHLA